MFELNAWGKIRNIVLEINKYADNGNLAIQMYEVSEDDFGNRCLEPWSVMTVNLGVKLPNNQAFVDVNNNGGDSFTEWIVENGIGEYAGQNMRSGWVSYPLFEFNVDYIKSSMGDN